MTIFWTLVRRELGSYFGSLSGYVVMGTVLFLLGLGCSHLILYLNENKSDIPLTELFYRTWYFWLIVLLINPAITMRTFAHEKSSGTYENLMTAPVGDSEVVLAKFAGSLIFYLIIWIPFPFCLLFLRSYIGEAANLDPGTMIATLLGITLVGSLFISLGCFASALTRNQTIAAMTSFALGIGLFILSFFAYSHVYNGGPLDPLMAQVSMIDHMEDFVRGVIDLRHTVYYLSLTAFFLFLNVKVVESRRWR